MRKYHMRMPRVKHPTSNAPCSVSNTTARCFHQGQTPNCCLQRTGEIWTTLFVVTKLNVPLRHILHATTAEMQKNRSCFFLVVGRRGTSALFLAGPPQYVRRYPIYAADTKQRNLIFRKKYGFTPSLLHPPSVFLPRPTSNVSAPCALKGLHQQGGVVPPAPKGLEGAAVGEGPPGALRMCGVKVLQLQ